VATFAPVAVDPAAPLVAPVAPPARGPARPALSLERYARIKVELWGRDDPRGVLDRHGVDEVDWLVHERRQASLLAGEAREGRCDLALALAAALAAARDPAPPAPPAP
jgi:hypothetical protein